MKALNSALPRLILYLAVAMIVAGIVLHGISFPVFERIWNNLLDRPAGPLTLRFLLQPMMSTIFGVRDGIRDAKLERTPYFWTILTDPAKRRARLREGMISTGKIIILAIILDLIYQIIELKTFYPAEALIVAVILAFIPYVIIRGLVGRIERWRQRRVLSSKCHEAVLDKIARYRNRCSCFRWPR
jgi:hypothetical protein